MRIKFFFVSLLMAVMGMTIASCSHDDEKDIPCDDCGKTRIQVVCEGADGVVSRGGSFVGGKVTGDGVYESDYGIVPVTATADDGYYVSYFRGGPKNAPNSVDYAGTGETTYSTKADTKLGNHMFHIGFKKKAVIYKNEITASNGGKAGSTFSGESGTRKEITATPDNGFKFVSWSCTGGASVESKTSAKTWATIGSSNGTITAQFAEKLYTIRISETVDGVPSLNAGGPFAGDNLGIITRMTSNWTKDVRKGTEFSIFAGDGSNGSGIVKLEYLRVNGQDCPIYGQYNNPYAEWRGPVTENMDITISYTRK